jgi:hypothetical protein
MMNCDRAHRMEVRLESLFRASSERTARAASTVARNIDQAGEREYRNSISNEAGRAPDGRSG